MKFKIETTTIVKHITAKDEKAAIRQFVKEYQHESSGTLKAVGKRSGAKKWYLYGKDIKFLK